MSAPVGRLNERIGSEVWGQSCGGAYVVRGRAPDTSREDAREQAGTTV